MGCIERRVEYKLNKFIIKIKPKCPRCRRKMEIVHDECLPKLRLYTAYCYNEIHQRLKVKMVTRFQTGGNNKRNETQYSMEGLTCFFCGGKMWQNKEDSHHAGNKLSYDCPNCKVNIQYLGKLLKTITYDEIIRVIVS